MSLTLIPLLTTRILKGGRRSVARNPWVERWADGYERALRYTMGLPISTTIVGMESMEQLKKNLAVAENFTPLGDEERLELYKEIVHLATPEVIRWKTTDYFNPVEWDKR